MSNPFTENRDTLLYLLRMVDTLTVRAVALINRHCSAVAQAALRERLEPFGAACGHVNYRFKDSGEFHGEYREYYPNNQIKLRCWFRYGKFHGNYEEWHRNGVRSVSGVYHHGARIGERHEWGPNGEPTAYYTYQNGQYAGRQYSWQANGAKYRCMNIMGSELHGKYYRWDFNETMVMQEYARDKQCGKDIQWNVRGYKVAIGNYKDDVAHGLFLLMYDDGKLCEIKNYKQGELHGEYLRWARDGTLIVHQVYKHDKLVEDRLKFD